MPTLETKTVKSAGGDYSSLAAWEAAEQADLTAADKIKEAECYAFSDDNGSGNGCVFAGWTTDADRYWSVRVASGNRHNGTSGTGYRLRYYGFGHGIDMANDAGRIDGVAFDSSDGSGGRGDRGIENQGSGILHVSNCLCVADFSNDAAFLRSQGWNGILKMWNCACALQNGMNWFSNSDGLFIFYNCTVHGYDSMTNFTALYSDDNSSFGAIVLKNCIAERGTNPSEFAQCYHFPNMDTTGSSNNMADDTSAPGSNPQNSTHASFISSTDLHLVAGSNGLDDGLNLSADADIPFNYDIEGNPRPLGSAWDLGAFELRQGWGKLLGFQRNRLIVQN